MTDIEGKFSKEETYAANGDAKRDIMLHRDVGVGFDRDTSDTGC